MSTVIDETLFMDSIAHMELELYGNRLRTLTWMMRCVANEPQFPPPNGVNVIKAIDPTMDALDKGREASPSAAAIDSQSIKAPHAEARGYDAGKKIVGRKRHIAVDTDGRLLMVNLTTADISDSAGAQATLDAIRKRWPWVKHLFADAAYHRLKLMNKAAYLQFVIEIIRRRGGQKGFEVLPRRWVVERTFRWMIRWRRLVRDYERRIDVSTAMIHVAMGGVLIRRNAHP